MHTFLSRQKHARTARFAMRDNHRDQRLLTPDSSDTGYMSTSMTDVALWWNRSRPRVSQYSAFLITFFRKYDIRSTPALTCATLALTTVVPSIFPENANPLNHLPVGKILRYERTPKSRGRLCLVYHRLCHASERLFYSGVKWSTETVTLSTIRVIRSELSHLRLLQTGPSSDSAADITSLV